MKAVLLDRDGVINRERSDYVKSWQEFEFLPGALSALRKLATRALPIVVITNQSAIGRGLVSAQVIDSLHRRLTHVVEQEGGRIDAFYVCPHHPNDNCACRKPKPGLLMQASRDFDLDLADCVFIGDSVTDWQAAQAAGCQCILVSSGKQGPHLRSAIDCDFRTPIYPDLSSAVPEIMARRRQHLHGQALRAVNNIGDHCFRLSR